MSFAWGSPAAAPSNESSIEIVELDKEGNDILENEAIGLDVGQQEGDTLTTQIEVAKSHKVKRFSHPCLLGVRCCVFLARPTDGGSARREATTLWHRQRSLGKGAAHLPSNRHYGSTSRRWRCSRDKSRPDAVKSPRNKFIRSHFQACATRFRSEPSANDHAL